VAGPSVATIFALRVRRIIHSISLNTAHTCCAKTAQPEWC
jgi:hypothetical protein